MKEVTVDEEKHKVHKNTKLLAIGVSDIRELTEGKVYEALYGWEEGIFENRPFVSVIDDTGKQYSCHLVRFRIFQPETEK